MLFLTHIFDPQVQHDDGTLSSASGFDGTFANRRTSPSHHRIQGSEQGLRRLHEECLY